jgi:hypothetical protein
VEQSIRILQSPEQRPILTVATSRQHDQQIYKDLLIGIARQLKWEVILEEDDHENEDVVIFRPGC